MEIMIYDCMPYWPSDSPLSPSWWLHHLQVYPSLAPDYWWALEDLILSHLYYYWCSRVPWKDCFPVVGVLVIAWWVVLNNLLPTTRDDLYTTTTL